MTMCTNEELREMRRKVSERLDALELDGEDSHGRLSAICGAVYESDFGWTAGACEALKSKLLMLLAADRAAHMDIARPITEGLRRAMDEDSIREGERMLVIGEDHFDDLCDAIDCVHAQLEAENATLRAELEALRPKPTRRDVLREFALRWAATSDDYTDALHNALLDEYEEQFELAEVE